MTIVSHFIEGVGSFEVEYVNGIGYEDLKNIMNRLANVDREVYDNDFKKIGSGSSARVYSYKHYAVKKLYDGYTFGTEKDNDVEVLKDLGHLDCMPTIYAVVNDNVLIMQLVNGVTVSDFCENNVKRSNIIIDDKFVEKWDDALLSVIANGYSPHDLHENNVMIEETTSNPIIVDTGWFFKHGNEYDINDKDSLRSDESYSRANRWAGRVIRDYVSNNRDNMYL